MAGKIFISYRREDSAGYAGRIYDHLERMFGRSEVFIDVDIIPIGKNFVDVVIEHVSQCSVLIAIIGPGWLFARNSDGKRRLDDPNDLVRIEVALALQRQISVIPVLIENTSLPRSEDLPINLKSLPLRNALWVKHSTFSTDVDKLKRAVTTAVAETKTSADFSFVGQFGDIKALAYSPGGHSFISGSSDATLAHWNVDTQSLLWKVEERAGVTSVAISPDGRVCAVTCLPTYEGEQEKQRQIRKGVLTLREVASGKPLKSVEDQYGFTSVVFSGDGKCLATYGGDNEVLLWEFPSCRSVWRLKSPIAHSIWTELDFSRDGSLLLSLSTWKAFDLWDVKSGGHLRSFKQGDEHIKSVAFAPDGVTCASATFEGSICFWNLRNGRVIHLSRHPGVFPRSIKYSPCGRYLLVNDRLLLNSPDGAVVREIGEGGSGSSAFSPDGRRLVQGGSNGRLDIWNTLII